MKSKNKILFIPILFILSFLLFHFLWKNPASSLLKNEFLSQEEGKFVRGSFQSKAKGEVPYFVYLPSGWKENDTTTYPLLIYLYGQGGNEYVFPYTVDVMDINRWIKNGEIPPMVIFCPNGSPDPEAIQWYQSKNETLLTAETGELRSFCRNKFRAGMSSNQIALEGQSRGAAGVLFYALKHSDKFSSFIANAYVSDYNLGTMKGLAQSNQQKIRASNFRLRMEIGSEDYFVKKHNRKGSEILDNYLNELNIPHKHEILEGQGHGYGQFWNFYRKKEKMQNGLFHLKYHAKAWTDE